MSDRADESIRIATRRNTALILSGLAGLSQRRVAELMGISESTLSDMKSDGRLERFASMLAALGLQLVPADAQVFDPKQIAALKLFAVLGLDNVQPQRQEVDA